MFASIYSEEFVTISANKELKIILVTWKGGCSSKEYRNAMEHSLDIAQDFKFESWISDTTSGVETDTADGEWLAKQFIPKALEQITKVALVVNESENIILNQDRSFCPKKVGYFDSLQEAEKWILHEVKVTSVNLVK
ncbi:MAG: hypothetical protein ACKVOU_00285 [Cytophagales bacterium]